MSDDVQFNLRIPSELKQRIVDAAKKNSRSINAEAQLRLERTFELDDLPEPSNPQNITDPKKLEEWAKSILKELLKLKELNERLERLESDVSSLEANSYDIENRINDLDGRGFLP
ncbi:TPA: Arc family DNA-binding protein [Acinetobacter baumannii]|uniref:Arc family DNA-binding protein n=1 Tax=Acinetobacter calcoaceticus/baumannii complex TaxID=909768 RepID=UPI0004519869|nr:MULTISPECIES: Arc family DNA-binding protein [Acinetobacter calcoaceticus/baumannii complex]EJB8486578.1 Arc family DNA-binding protein [Acinetobacter baumannii]EKU0660101.1 Arc family DNA-binding protein [Acinetobacter baumannii]EKU2442696.1 Arc family DNA-binding protein [Acinetobacter baumannii]EKU2730616.1 Arc family DNA-binding protein [Acinetobacter baumannii]EKU5230116.1 Arc family DNA-binding protein [Acinetobacter baumannii]